MCVRHMKHMKIEKASSPTLLLEQIEQHLRGERAGEIIALNRIDVPFFQQRDLFLGLHALGDDVIAHPLEGGDVGRGRAVETVNRTGIRDKKLYQLAVDMRKTEPGDVLSCR